MPAVEGAAQVVLRGTEAQDIARRDRMRERGLYVRVRGYVYIGTGRHGQRVQQEHPVYPPTGFCATAAIWAAAGSSEGNSDTNTVSRSRVRRESVF